MENMIKVIEGSEMWERLNANVKALYEAEGRTPSEEEYQAVRNMMILKVMTEDPAAIEAMAKETYNALH